MQRSRLEARIPGFFKPAESYVLRTKLGPYDVRPKKKKPVPMPSGPGDAAKEACDEIFADIMKSGLAEKIASYGQPVRNINAEGAK